MYIPREVILLSMCIISRLVMEFCALSVTQIFSSVGMTICLKETSITPSPRLIQVFRSPEHNEFASGGPITRAGECASLSNID